MKANELMIGDWVCVTKNFTQKYHKIRALSNDEGAVFRGIYVNEYGVKSHSIFSPNDIEPIPLTKEILKKNGFKVREYSDDTEYFYHDGYRINIDFNEGLPADDIPPTIFLLIDFAKKDIAIPIEYVHELQQAMRIMGCDKTIEL